MDLTFFKNLIEDFKHKWFKFNSFQKLAFITSLAGLFLILIALIVISTSNSYVPLFSSNRMERTNIPEMISYLQGANIPYKMRSDNVILVPAHRQHQIRMELAAYGMPRTQSSKGYDLFDSNTWIKGEKELQVLELRALKGELEQDISQFDNIRAANVNLEIPPPRPFGGPQQQAKASIVLTLKPGARMSPQGLRAITFHVASAVRGLNPNMIAISDTNGKLYQSIDPDSDYDMLRHSENTAEEYIKAKIDGMLSNVVGSPDHFYSTVQVAMNRDKMSQERKVFSGTVGGVNLGQPVLMSVSESSQQEQLPSIQSWILGKRVHADTDSENRPGENKQLAVPMDYVKMSSAPGKIESISVGILIDRAVLDTNFYNQTLEELKADLESQVATILKGYGVQVNESINFIRFNHPPITDIPTTTQHLSSQPNPTGFMMASGLIGLIGGILLTWFYYYYSQTTKKTGFEEPPEAALSTLEAKIESLKKQERNKPLWHILHSAEIEQLADFLKQQPPKAVGLMIGALESARAAAILEAMPIDQQTEVLKHLNSTKRLFLLEIIEKNNPILASQLRTNLEEVSL